MDIAAEKSIADLEKKNATKQAHMTSRFAFGGEQNQDVTTHSPQDDANISEIAVAFHEEDEDELKNSTPSPGLYKREIAQTVILSP